MKKIVLFFSIFIPLELLQAKMSDDEKRTFLENLAQPSREKKIFYRWQSERSAQTLLQEKEMTPKLYQYYMNMKDMWAGAGMYVSEDIVSSTRFGAEIVQVEIEPGYKYLDLLNENIQAKLKAAGIGIEEVYRLNPQVAITDTKEELPYWVLKGQKGIQFKPFSPKNIDIEHLSTIYIMGKSPHLNDTILKEIFRRAEQNLSSVAGTSFTHVLTEKYGKTRIRKAILQRAQSLKNVQDAMDLLGYTTGYTSQGEISPYLTLREIKKIINKAIVLVQTPQDGFNLLRRGGMFLTDSQKEDIINKSLPLIKTVSEGVHLIKLTKYFIKPSRHKELIKKTIAFIKTPQEGIALMKQANEYLDRESIKQIATQVLELDLEEANSSNKIRPFLREKEYQEVTTKVSANKKARLDCLRNQLSVMTTFWTDYE